MGPDPQPTQDKSSHQGLQTGSYRPRLLAGPAPGLPQPQDQLPGTQAPGQSHCQSCPRSLKSRRAPEAPGYRPAPWAPGSRLTLVAGWPLCPTPQDGSHETRIQAPSVLVWPQPLNHWVYPSGPRAWLAPVGPGSRSTHTDPGPRSIRSNLVDPDSRPAPWIRHQAGPCLLRHQPPTLCLRHHTCAQGL